MWTAERDLDRLVAVENLKSYFLQRRSTSSSGGGYVRAVDDVSFHIRQNECLALVGESGCGKTTICRSVGGLLRPYSGKIFYRGVNINQASKKEFRAYRGAVQMVFQDPYSSLNPRKTVLQTLGEPLRYYKLANRRNVRGYVAELLLRVGLDENSLERYPHEFSGGERQRIGVARAICLEPELILCDEPVSALDVSVRSQILNMLFRLQTDLHLTYLFITHDLSIVRVFCDRVLVMYLGKIVEAAPTEALFSEPFHPYSEALISATPVPDPDSKGRRIILQGDIPSSSEPPGGCYFHTRCPKKVGGLCDVEPPMLVEMGGGRSVACHLAR